LDFPHSENIEKSISIHQEIRRNMSKKPTFNLKKAKLDFSSEIDLFINGYYWWHNIDFHLDWILTMFSLAFSVAVVVAGFLDQARTAAFFGIGVSFLIALHNAFPLGEKAEFYRILISEARNIKLELSTVTKFDNYQRLITRFKRLNENAARRLPRGQGMEAVRKLQEDLFSK
jgi:hypothetical protein